ncbi:MAG TPA: bifunctional DNA-binding transcriptional regulator/O6-methylguanine-DNA methyltransferase Ada [Pseudomonadales bacterium]|nr:bifunctional DNA-binding transcriptional regulator/O6-methylguanine-DNA methyltransferase Ada [Pseudomonadales bacterium]
MSQPAQPTAERCWRAVTERDASADDFVYAVLTTGIYCRPGCPSRQPLRANVLFFPNGLAARGAGFRACRRCRPGSGAVPAWLEQACRTFENAAGASVAAVAEACGVDRSTLHRAFVDALGLAPGAYRAAARGRRLRAALAVADSVTSALYEAGFSGPSRAYAAAHEDLGMAPGEIRAGGADLRIRHATGTCALGTVLVASSDRGLCLVEFLDPGEDPAARVRARFPRAAIAAADAGASADVAAVVAVMEDPRVSLDLPLDIRGTAFQRRVWDELRTLGWGTTVSYGELARRIGRPGAARAVARACADNRLAVLVPCHRVVAADGAVGGYRWGVERKARLLARESEESEESQGA